MKYLIVGNGGREHALAWKLCRSPQVELVYCMPGNGGTAGYPYKEKYQNVPIVPIKNIPAWAKTHSVDCVIPGNEEILMGGIVDMCREHDLAAFGPHRDAALLEGSKSFAKTFMNTHGIRTARHYTAISPEEASRRLNDFSYPLVLKADGLAAGKGVIICDNRQQAADALLSLMVKKTFGEAGGTVVMEEFLDGFEASVISMYDGKTIVPFISAKDHKKIHEGGTGPNTGGMGVVAPNPLFTPRLHEDFVQHILLPTQHGLTREKRNFCGFIFFGIMVVNDNCYLLEYNMRFGDPEAQALLPLMDSDLSGHIHSAFDRTLRVEDIMWKNALSCCVVLASGGYPGSYAAGKIIDGLTTADLPNGYPDGVDSHIFCAGVNIQNDVPVTSGGRVLSVVGVGGTLTAARERAYKSVKNIDFEGAYFRGDIGVAE